jgi:hypothetical protein
MSSIVIVSKALNPGCLCLKPQDPGSIGRRNIIINIIVQLLDDLGLSKIAK